MGWQESSLMDERMRFITDCIGQEEAMSTLCLRYGISRKTGYKWLLRYESKGLSGLVDESRRPSARR